MEFDGTTSNSMELELEKIVQLGILPPHGKLGIFFDSIWGGDGNMCKSGLDPIGYKSCSCFPLFTEKLLVIVVTILKDPFI